MLYVYKQSWLKLRTFLIAPPSTHDVRSPFFAPFDVFRLFVVEKLCWLLLFVCLSWSDFISWKHNGISTCFYYLPAIILKKKIKEKLFLNKIKCYWNSKHISNLVVCIKKKVNLNWFWYCSANNLSSIFCEFWEWKYVLDLNYLSRKSCEL
jgi:hypothetical protein